MCLGFKYTAVEAGSDASIVHVHHGIVTRKECQILQGSHHLHGRCSGVDNDYLLPATQEDMKLFATVVLRDAEYNQGLATLTTNLSSSTMTTTADLLQRALYKVHFDTQFDSSNSPHQNYKKHP